MKTKFLSAVLLGGFLAASTGTFVSCKDYDDDITDLQEQIDALKTASDLKASLTEMSSAIAAAQQSAEAKAAAAQTAADAAASKASSAADAAAAAQKAVEDLAKSGATQEAVDAAQAAADAAAAAASKAQATAEDAAKAAQEVADAAKVNASAISALADRVTALEEELAGLSDNEEVTSGLAAQFKALQADVEATIGTYSTAVTAVSLVSSYTSLESFGQVGTDLEFVSIIEQANVFGKGLDGEITFTKDAQVQRPATSFLIRVSPADAVVAPENISLVNSKGENLDDQVVVTKVEKYDGLLTRAANESGLRQVTVELKNYDAKAFEAATQVTNADKSISKVLYAVQINNTLESAETRYVTSSYDVTLAKGEYTPASELNFTVNGTDIAKLANRYNNTSSALKQTTNLGTIPTEYVWATSTETNPTPATAIADKNANVQQGDDRSKQALLVANQGQTIKVNLYETVDETTVKPTDIRAIYVTLDSDRAVESAPSELNAWNSYTYTGLNQVVEAASDGSLSTEITIDSKTAINDIIGFRVYAVNYDGTLVDPDGKAFYVVLANESAVLGGVATTITPTSTDVTESAKAAATIGDYTPASDGYAWNVDKISEKPAFGAKFYDKDGNVVLTVTEAGVATLESGKALKDITTVATTKNSDIDWTAYEDGKAYSGTLTMSDENGASLASITVSFTKVLPVGLPDGYSLRDKQVVKDVYKCFVLPETAAGSYTVSWGAESATYGYMDVQKLLNLDDFTGDAKQLTVTIAEASYDATAKKNVDLNVAGNGYIEVAKSYINGADHKTTISYNYGKISSVKNAQGTYDDYVQYDSKYSPFNTQFRCVFDSDVNTWAWAKNAKNELTYGADGTIAANLIVNTNTYNSDFAQNLDTFLTGDKMLKINDKKGITLVSKDTGKEDYFTVAVDGTNLKFTAVKSDTSSNPQENVKSILTINALDAYSHEIVITLDVVVKKK